MPGSGAFELVVDGTAVTVTDDRLTLLDVLREQLRIRSVKDGCSPQGQCGCCTVLVDERPRLACVTPARRVRDQRITTLDGLDDDVRERWAQAFSAAGASQCGFCTPGIICRFAGLDAKGADHHDRNVAKTALAAHLCRCTGWQPIVDAWVAYPRTAPHSQSAASEASMAVGVRAAPRSAGSDQRATIEGRSQQVTGACVALGAGGFADDLAPPDALVAVRAGEGCLEADPDGWVVAPTAAQARRLAGCAPGRRTTASWGPPLDVPPGDWALTLCTSWVEPCYLETDAAWCEPGGEPATPLGNGGAFGAKRDSQVTAAARRLADVHGHPVRVLWSRPDAAALGPKRPPVAAGVRRDGTAEMRVVRTAGIAEIINTCAPGFVVSEVDVPGPPTSANIRAAGWAEAAVLLAAIRDEPGWITAPDGGTATAEIDSSGEINITVCAGRPLDSVVLRSYCTGGAHMAYSWVTSESLAVDPNGGVHDLTVRSFGITSAAAMPRVNVEIVDDGHEPTNGSDAVFTAVAAAIWRHRGLPGVWPTDR